MIIPENSTLFGLLRHGKTVWNEEGRIQGSKNSPLTESGKRGVLAWLPTLRQTRWNRILCSDLGRVQETVNLLNDRLGLPCHTEPRLREQDWGVWEGCRLETIRSEHAEELERRVHKGWNFAAPGGESRHAVFQRTYQALHEWGKRYPAEKILVVCHQGVIKCLLYRLASRKFLPDEGPLVDPDCLHTVTLNGELHIRTLNIPKTAAS